MAPETSQQNRKSRTLSFLDCLSRHAMGILPSLLNRRSQPSTQPSTPPKASQLPPANELHRVFNKFDSNGDGKISSSELAAIFDSLGQPLTQSELHRMMVEADTDGDGFISIDEFVNLNTARVDPEAALEDLRHAFSIFDTDKNGSISAEELARVLRGIGEAASVAQCRRMIKGVDQDGDGMISFEEFKVMMQASGLGSAIVNKI